MSLIGIVDNGSDIVGSNLWLISLLLGADQLFLGLFNLLPLLPFDGGHAAIATYERIASKVKHRRVVRRLPQVDPGRRGADRPDPVRSVCRRCSSTSVSVGQ